MNPDPASLAKLHLHPGELLITADACEIHTVLGSCVAVTLFHRQTGLAAICHITLPFPLSPNPALDRGSQRFRYASDAIPHLMQSFCERGIEPASIEVGLFGGSCLSANLQRQPEIFRVGRANIAEARHQLKSHSLRMTQEDVGSCLSRKVIFNTQSGQVLCLPSKSLYARQPESSPPITCLP